MKKNCIFDNNIFCSNCGECNKCDLDSNKACNNCGKCLLMEGFDARAINIDEIMDDDAAILDESECLEENNERDIDFFAELNKDLVEADVKVEYIDDIDGLSEVLEEDNNNYLKEIFPGVMVINKNKN